MLRTLTVFALCGFLAAGAHAQGAGGGGPSKPTLGQQIVNQAMSGSGFAQEDFMGTVNTGLKEKFGSTTGGKMQQNFQNNAGSLEGKEMTQLMNGQMPSQKVQELFGASNSQKSRLKEVIEEAVDDKDHKVFFGIIIVILVSELGIDPEGDFCQQVAGARDEISDDTFEKLKDGNVSRKTCKEAFGFSNKEDQKIMQEALKGMSDSPFMSHPTCESLGMAPKGAKFDPEKCGEFGEGMAGFGQYEDGMAGGAPMPELPPLPFLGTNMGEIFEGCKAPGDEGETPEGAPAAGEGEADGDGSAGEK